MTITTTEAPRNRLRVAMIGGGLMAKSHTIAYNALPALFPDAPRPELSLLADASDALAEQSAARLGFRRWTSDWRAAVTDPDIDVVDIVTPNWLHHEVAMAAIEAGKHVYCEKPLAVSAADARRMWEAADAAGVTTIVGFSYLGNPALQHTKRLIDEGVLGDIWSVKAHFILDANADPSLPRTWHYERAKAGLGALGDIGSHVVAIVEMLCGPLIEVWGRMQTVIPERPEAVGALSYGSRAAEGARLLPVENDDITTALGTFASGATATLEANRVGNGHAFDLGVEVTGSLGSVRFTQQSAHQIELFLRESGASEPQAVSVVPIGPQHPDFGAYWPMAGIPIGLHELKAIEIKNLFVAIAEGRAASPSFYDGWRVTAVLEAIEQSHRSGGWTSIPS